MGELKSYPKRKENVFSALLYDEETAFSLFFIVKTAVRL